jgi:GNAT superfamily N-acetyltransferase
LEIREMTSGEEPIVLALVMRGFDELVRPDFTEEGAAEFTRTALSFIVDHPPGHRVTVAERDGRIVGMIDVRDASRICLFFIEPSERRRGLGRALLDAAQGDSASPPPTVNSSPWAVPVYQRLGFTATGPPIEHKGMRAIPMARQGQRDGAPNKRIEQARSRVVAHMSRCARNSCAPRQAAVEVA